MDARSVRIPESRIQENYDAAFALLQSAEVSRDVSRGSDHPGRTNYISPVLAGRGPKLKQKANFEQALSDVTPEDAMLSPAQYQALHAARRALAVGMTISEFFVEPLGYLDLGQQKKSGRLSAMEEDRFRELVRARALVATFVAASHFLHQNGEPDIAETTDPGEWPTDSTNGALGWFVSTLAEGARSAADAKDLAPRLARAATNVIDRLETDAHRMLGNDLSAFTSTSYAVEADGFSVRGFEVSAKARSRKPLVMQFKQPHEVVGNHIAKSQSLKLAKMLMAYDFEHQKNPFVDLGGFVFTFIGDGFPGTGKTTLIQMIAGLVKDYCDMAGYGFTYENFGIDQISEYQGKSGQNCKSFIERVMDSRTIGFGTIDDIDQVAGKRDDQRSSGGQQEVTAVLMESFSGAGTVIRGNCSFGMFSNYPEKVDDALRQRAGARWLVDGPQTRSDYIDIFALLLGKDHTIPLGDHDLYADQILTKAVAKSYQKHSVPEEAGLKIIWDTYQQQHGDPDTLTDVGTYLHLIKEAEPRLTGRAIKNITDAVKYRAMDVDLPDEWFERPEDFTGKSWDEKSAMIAELRRPITMEMIVQEINRYADSEFRYTDKSDEAAVSALIRDNRVRSEAARRIAETND